MKIAKIAMETLGKLQSMPKGGKAAMLVGAGALLGGLAVDLMSGDSFEKEETKKQETAVVSNPNTQLKAEAKVEEKPEAQKEPEFEYVPPTVGKDGIAKADTTMYPGTQKIHTISYYDKDGNRKQVDDYDKNGKMARFEVEFPNGYKIYNQAGDLVSSRVELDGTTEMYDEDPDSGYWNRTEYDSKGRMIYDETQNVRLDTSSLSWYLSTHECRAYSYNSDGSFVEDVRGDKELNGKITYDKSGKVVQEKRYDKNGQLKYTVNPKYNKEGDIIKRDTIPNS
jgi:hypothetical protein